MPYDETLVNRLRICFQGRPDVVEKKMFGGIAFMVSGHMCVGVSNSDLMARIGPDRYGTAMARKGVREMDFTGRPLNGFVFVSKDGVADEEDLASWVQLCEEFVRSLPPK